MKPNPIEILLIEDSPSDIELIKVSFQQGRVANNISVISDGEKAWHFFDRVEELPDLILLDINLPKINGLDILRKIRATERTRNIPVIVLTSSDADKDVIASYTEKANSFITKPVDLNKFMHAIRSIEEFWMTVVRLP